MGKYKSYLLVYRSSSKGATLYTDQYGPFKDEEEWHRALVQIPKRHRPTRLNVYHNGKIPNPIPLYWCEVCDCWALKPTDRHSHPPERFPQEGQVWVEDCTKKHIPAGVLDLDEWPDGDNDPRWVVRRRHREYAVLSVEKVEAAEPFSHNGVKYKGWEEHSIVHYRTKHVGDWSDDEIPYKWVFDGHCTLKQWRDWNQKWEQR